MHFTTVSWLMRGVQKHTRRPHAISELHSLAQHQSNECVSLYLQTANSTSYTYLCHRLLLLLLQHHFDLRSAERNIPRPAALRGYTLNISQTVLRR